MHWVAIHLKRSDRLLQAISYERARQSRQWSAHFSASGSRIAYSYDGIRSRLSSIEDQEIVIADFLSRRGLASSSVTYEALAADPVETLSNTLQGLQLPTGAGPADAGALVRQSDAVSLAWRQRYIEDAMSRFAASRGSRRQ
jgi:LPS sulfotransferase NodH